MKRCPTTTNTLRRSKSFVMIDRSSQVGNESFAEKRTIICWTSSSCLSCSSIVWILDLGEEAESLSHLWTRWTRFQSERFLREVPGDLRGNEMATETTSSADLVLVLLPHVPLEWYFIQLRCFNQYSRGCLLSLQQRSQRWVRYIRRASAWHRFLLVPRRSGPPRVRSDLEWPVRHVNCHTDETQCHFYADVFRGRNSTLDLFRRSRTNALAHGGNTSNWFPCSIKPFSPLLRPS